MHDFNNRLFFSAARPECLHDPECPNHLACIEEKCQNPCNYFTCGRNAECRVKEHRATCTCLHGYEGGNPNVECKKREYTNLNANE